MSLLHEMLAWSHAHGDKVNGMFEAFGAWSAWANVKRILRDRDVKGIVWQFTVVWWSWGLWNILYYPSLEQMFSFYAGLALVAGNFVWLCVWIPIVWQRWRSNRRIKRQMVAGVE